MNPNEGLRMNICLVGYGSIAGWHMEAFRRIEGVNPHVLVGRREEPAAAFARKWGFPHHSLDFDSALADPAVDAVVITSPSELHAPQALKTLHAGKHLLLEIPVALTLSDAEQVTAAAEQAGRRVMVCHTLRFAPCLQEVRRRVDAGELHLHQIISFAGINRRSNTTVFGEPRSWTDNILWHHCAHLVDLALWVSGCDSPENISCHMGPEHPVQKLMDVSMSMTLDDGCLATVVHSYNADRFRWRTLFIGEEETLELDQDMVFGDTVGLGMPGRQGFDLYTQNSEFVAAVREGRDPAITPRSVLPTMKSLQAAENIALGK